MRLSYRCRRCGKLFFAGEIDVTHGDMVNVLKEAIIKRTTATPMGSPPVLIGVAMESVHKCNEQALGIADLQGAA